jgi:hypothetical protein
MICLGAGEPASAAVFQYAIEVATNRGEREAFLWIPPAAPAVRGIVVGGMTLAEREMVKDERIRSACAREQLAIVFLKCGLGSVDLQQVLDKFAHVSGYGELSTAPLMFFGHSAGGPQAKRLAIAMSSRCFALVQYRGGVPGGEQVVPPGIPMLMMIGQFDEFGKTMRSHDGRENWEGGRDALAAYRAMDERNLASIVVEPGAGHFAWSDRNAEYLALFLAKAAQARIGLGTTSESSPTGLLRDIDHRQGWLTDLASIDATGSVVPQRYDHYSGDKQNAAWHFDRAMAEATIAYHADGLGKRDQFLRWEDPHWVDAGARFFFTKLKWVEPGHAFQVHPVYADAYPTQYNGRGPRWYRAGMPAGRSAAQIRVRPVGGPVVATSPNTLRIQFDALAPADEKGRVTFLAFSPGDDAYRCTEQVGMMPRGFSGFNKGRPQQIAFPCPNDLRADGDPVTLSASSDCGLPVEYYVAHGPARIVGDQMMIAELPRRATFPIAVKVVAWQFGRGIEPLVATAAPVAHTIHIRAPAAER